MIFSRFLPQTMLMTLFHVEGELQIMVHLSLSE